MSIQECKGYTTLDKGKYNNRSEIPIPANPSFSKHKPENISPPRVRQVIHHSTTPIHSTPLQNRYTERELIEALCYEYDCNFRECSDGLDTQRNTVFKLKLFHWNISLSRYTPGVYITQIPSWTNIWSYGTVNAVGKSIIT